MQFLPTLLGRAPAPASVSAAERRFAKAVWDLADTNRFLPERLIDRTRERLAKGAAATEGELTLYSQIRRAFYRRMADCTTLVSGPSGTGIVCESG